MMLEVQYEEAVAHIERQARQIVAYCGLERDDACLAFCKTQHPIPTASATQVRQPVYRTSVWYPGLRVYRQPQPGDWDSALAEITRDRRGLSVG
jgi:hypothetical protein